jgi:hypothetical protein
MEPRVQSSSSSEDDNTEEIEVTFRATRAGDSSNVLYFTGPSDITIAEMYTFFWT